MSENKIDELFKKGLREAEIPFEEAHWRDMKKKLSQDGNRRRDIIYWTSLGGAAAMLVMALGWWAISPVDIQADKVVKNNPSKAETTAELPAKEPAKLASADITAPKHAVKTADNFTGNTTKAFLPQQVLPVVINNGSDKQAVNSDQSPKQQDAFVSAVPRKEDMPVQPQNADNAPVKEAAVIPSSPVNPVLAMQPVKQVLKDSARISDHKPGFKPAFVLSLTAAPDLNAVNSFSNTKRGFNGGILATVSLSPRLSVTTGAVLAKKVYETPFANYKPSSGYVFPVSPYDVLADCRVLDIPLNLNYTFLNKGNTRVGFSAGASSYLMLSENYDFKYQNPYAKSPKNFRVRSQNQHYLGVANLALSYEKKLNNNASVAFQPFAKVPLTQIGNGNVKLLSAGVSVNLNINVSTITGKKP